MKRVESFHDWISLPQIGPLCRAANRLVLYTLPIYLELRLKFASGCDMWGTCLRGIGHWIFRGPITLSIISPYPPNGAIYAVIELPIRTGPKQKLEFRPENTIWEINTFKWTFFLYNPPLPFLAAAHNVSSSVQSIAGFTHSSSLVVTVVNAGACALLTATVHRTARWLYRVHLVAWVFECPSCTSLSLVFSAIHIYIRALIALASLRVTLYRCNRDRE